MTPIDLVLVDVAAAMGDDNSCGREKFHDLIGQVLMDCSTAEAFLASGDACNNAKWKDCCRCLFVHCPEGPVLSEEEVAERLKKSVAAFINPNDQYLQLTSLLLKSQTFHLAFATENDRPIIHLPRTKAGKPYIPGRKSFQFSVSHQFPFAGIARCRTKGKGRVGMDIVVFETLNTRLYNNPEDFVEVFRSNFAESEWNAILTATDTVKEFYLRWAIKEAYTKARGLGMSLAFSSFETKLNGVDGSLWEYVATTDNWCSLSGEVFSFKNCRKEMWHFFFHKLKSGAELKGCIAVCTGPVALTRLPNPEPFPEITWTSIHDLSDWHYKSLLN